MSSDAGLTIELPPQPNPHWMLALGLLGIGIILAIAFGITVVATENLRAELKATKTLLVKAEANARTAYGKLYDEQERAGEEIEALRGQHSMELYALQRKCPN